jgi:hypothetical protein
MHQKWGYAEKADNCKQFPFTFTSAPDGVRVGLLFSCEGVAQASPQLPLPLEEAQAIFPIAHQVFSIGETFPLTPKESLSFSDYLLFENHYFSVLKHQASASLEDRLIALSLWLDQLVLTSASQRKAFLQNSSLGTERYFQQALPLKGNRRIQRSFTLMMMTLLDSMRHGSQGLGFLRLFSNQWKAQWNRGKVSIFQVGSIPLKPLESIPFPPLEEERLQTFLIQLVWRRRLLFKTSIHRGFRLICLYYGLTRFLARALCQLKGESQISNALLLEALEILERYYISHSKFSKAFETQSSLTAFLNPIFFNSAFVPILIRSS